MLKLITLIVISNCLLAGGQTLIKQAMNSLGEINILSLKGFIQYIKFCLTRGKIALGFSLNTVSFFIWLIILSGADLSLAYPLNSFTYIAIALFAKIFLKENVGILRWAGIALIVCGIFIVGLK